MFLFIFKLLLNKYLFNFLIKNYNINLYIKMEPTNQTFLN